MIKKLWEERFKKKISSIFFTIATIAYMISFIMLIIVPSIWEIEDGCFSIKIVSIFFILGAACSGIGTILVIMGEESWLVTGEEEKLTEEELKKINDLLSKFDQWE